MTTSADGTARLWDASTCSQRAALVSFNNGGWAVTDPEGSYDTDNPNESEGMHWVVRNEVIQFSN